MTNNASTTEIPSKFSRLPAWDAELLGTLLINFETVEHSVGLYINGSTARVATYNDLGDVYEVATTTVQALLEGIASTSGEREGAARLGDLEFQRTCDGAVSVKAIHPFQMDVCLLESMLLAAIASAEAEGEITAP